MSKICINRLISCWVPMKIKRPNIYFLAQVKFIFWKDQHYIGFYVFCGGKTEAAKREKRRAGAVSERRERERENKMGKVKQICYGQ